MRALTKGKLSGFFAAIFLAGVVCGSAFSLHVARRGQPLQTVEKACYRMHQQLKTRLSLSNRQVEAIEPILERLDRRIREVQSHTMGRMDEVVRQSLAEVEPLLSAAQKVELRRYEAERRQRTQDGCANGQKSMEIFRDRSN